MDTIPTDPAVRAFEALRAEIAGLAAEIVAVRAEQRTAATRPIPDYDLTLGQIAKQLTALTAYVAAIEDKPALGFTPGSFGGELGSIVRAQAGVATQRVLDAVEAMKDQARDLQGAASSVISRAVWRRRTAGGAALGLVAGIMLCFGVIAVFPAGAGAWMAATVLGNGPWEAGQTLMRQGEPDAFGRMARLYKACPHNVPTDLCEAAMIIGTMPAAVPAPGKGR